MRQDPYTWTAFWLLATTCVCIATWGDPRAGTSSQRTLLVLCVYVTLGYFAWTRIRLYRQGLEAEGRRALGRNNSTHVLDPTEADGGPHASSVRLWSWRPKKRLVHVDRHAVIADILGRAEGIVPVRKFQELVARVESFMDSYYAALRRRRRRGGEEDPSLELQAMEEGAHGIEALLSACVHATETDRHADLHEVSDRLRRDVTGRCIRRVRRMRSIKTF